MAPFGLQHIVALEVSTGAFVLGVSIGWSSFVDVTLRSVSSWDGTNVTSGEFTKIKNPQLAFAMGAAVGALAVIAITALTRPFKRGTSRNLGATGLPGLIIGWYLLWSANIDEDKMYKGRFSIGISSGVFSVLIPMYITEISRAGLRNLLLVYYQVMMCGGIAVAYAIAWYFFDEDVDCDEDKEPVSLTRYNFCCGAVCLVALCTTLIPASPMEKIYFEPDDPDLAAEIMDELGMVSTEYVDDEIDNLRNVILHGRNKLAYCGVKFIIMLFTMAFLMFGEMHCGVLFILMNSQTLFQPITAQDKKYSPAYINMMVGGIIFLSSIIAAVFIGFFGKKVNLVFGGVTMSASISLIAYISQEMQKVPLLCEETLSVLYGLCLVYFIAWNHSLGPGSRGVLSDSFPIQWRHIVTPIFTCYSWASLWLLIKLYHIYEDSYGFHGMMYYFAGCSLMVSFVSLLLVEDHGGRNLVHIQDEDWDQDVTQYETYGREHRGWPDVLNAFLSRPPSQDSM